MSHKKECGYEEDCHTSYEMKCKHPPAHYNPVKDDYSTPEPFPALIPTPVPPYYGPYEEYDLGSPHPDDILKLVSTSSP